MPQSVPQRTCRICRRKVDKADLMRWVRQGGIWVQDQSQILEGRGYYTCSNDCAQKLQQRTG